jgi:hypothetical protein
MNREQIIMSMCYTFRHDYGLDRTNGDLSGTNKSEREYIHDLMSKLFDNDIAPHMTFRLTEPVDF